MCAPLPASRFLPPAVRVVRTDVLANTGSDVTSGDLRARTENVYDALGRVWKTPPLPRSP